MKLGSVSGVAGGQVCLSVKPEEKGMNKCEKRGDPDGMKRKNLLQLLSERRRARPLRVQEFKSSDRGEKKGLRQRRSAQTCTGVASSLNLKRELAALTETSQGFTSLSSKRCGLKRGGELKRGRERKKEHVSRFG